jgi:hypothetical protein
MMYRYSEKTRTNNRSTHNDSPSSPGQARMRRPRRTPRWARKIKEERGAIAAFVVVSLVGIIGAGGLAVDLGRGYLRQIRISRAVDAAAIAAASAVRQGQTVAEQQGRAVAALNGITDGQNDVTFSLSFDLSAQGETTVAAQATQPLPTTLMRIMGWEEMDIGASAVAAVPPVDLSLVLDQSGSLAREGAWDDLQGAVIEFLGNFSDVIDQFSLTHFQVRADTPISMTDFFTTPMTTEIQNMVSAGDTNTGEGLRLGMEQMQLPVLRPRSRKVLVFFTDGRPTAFRNIINGRDRVMAVSVYQTGRVRGYFNNPDQLSMDNLARADGCRNVSSCFGWRENAVRNEARRKGLQMADQIRSQGVLLYTIGLGDPDASDPIVQPDLDYLRQLANEDGITNPAQPKGRMYFAPSPDVLGEVFRQLARDLLVRLAQ